MFIVEDSKPHPLGKFSKNRTHLNWHSKPRPYVCIRFERRGGKTQSKEELPLIDCEKPMIPTTSRGSQITTLVRVDNGERG